MDGSVQSPNDQRERQRYKINAPVSVLVGKHKIPGFTQNLSNQGVFFRLDATDNTRIPDDFNFLIELPPEVTLSTGCSVRCRGRLLRTETLPGQFTGVAAKILHYSLQKAATSR